MIQECAESLCSAVKTLPDYIHFHTNATPQIAVVCRTLNSVTEYDSLPKLNDVISAYAMLYNKNRTVCYSLED
jgi:hypothetical protein